MTEFVVELEVFEGPLDLLLTLVRREQLDITQVALAAVTDSYLRYMAALEEIDPGALAEFCEVAASLLLIKSRALLPSRPHAEEAQEVDGQELVDRLREYRLYRDAAERLGEREHEGLRAYVRVAARPDAPVVLAPGEASVADLAAAFQSALAEAAERVPPEPVGGVRPHRIRLSERLPQIRSLLERRGRVSFREVLLGERPTKDYVIVSFLAILELLRRGVARAAQDELFGEIILELRPDAPAATTADEAELDDLSH
ncbi:MAG: segregation and condensation protein A [Anaerolineae bacterium]